MAQHPNIADEMIAALSARFPVKVWSCLVTVFGDQRPDEGAEVSGPVLTALTERIGVRPEAMRVALHRLRKDGWIEVRKSGRISHYRLSGDRLSETRAAGARIFAEEITPRGRWHVVISEADAAAEQSPGALMVAPGLMLSEAPPEGDARAYLVLETPGGAVPDWLREKFIPDEWSADCADLLDHLRRISARRAELAGLGPLDQAALRLMLVHNWRRIILRLPEAAERLQAPDWRGHICRREMAALLRLLPRPETDEISAERG